MKQEVIPGRKQYQYLSLIIGNQKRHSLPMTWGLTSKSNSKFNVWCRWVKVEIGRICAKLTQNIFPVKIFSEKNSYTPDISLIDTMVTRYQRSNPIAAHSGSWSLTCFQETSVGNYSFTFCRLFILTRVAFCIHWTKSNNLYIFLTPIGPIIL